MKGKLIAAWLVIPYAAAIASDSGAPFRVIGWILLAWLIGTLAGMELYRRHEEARRQRRLSACRRRTYTRR